MWVRDDASWQKADDASLLVRMESEAAMAGANVDKVAKLDGMQLYAFTDESLFHVAEQVAAALQPLGAGWRHPAWPLCEAGVASSRVGCNSRNSLWVTVSLVDVPWMKRYMPGSSEAARAIPPKWRLLSP